MCQEVTSANFYHVHNMTILCNNSKICHPSPLNKPNSTLSHQLYNCSPVIKYAVVYMLQIYYVPVTHTCFCSYHLKYDNCLGNG